MCLLVHQSKGVSFTDAFLQDVYGKNEDGLGIMYAEDNKVHVYKCLPANAQDFVDFYNKHAAKRECVWHARMKTHGDIDMDNCHPYMVTDDIWLSHNGVLSTGNNADPSKSDTWHFIKNVLRPALSMDPDLMVSKDWLSFIGNLIGSGNKFGLVRSDGKTAVINRGSGVEYMQSWLSNTYAWSPGKFGFAVAQPRYSNASAMDQYWRRMQAEYEDDVEWPTVPTVSTPPKKQAKVCVPEKVTEQQIKRYIRAAYNQWTRHGVAGLEQWVYDAPDKASAVLSYWYEDVEDIENLPYLDPDDAAVWIDDIIRTDSVTPSWLA